LYRIITAASEKGEMLDIESNIESQPFTVGPVEITPLINRRIIVAIVSWQLEHMLDPLFTP
jgi:hypothetical protein